MNPGQKENSRCWAQEESCSCRLRKSIRQVRQLEHIWLGCRGMTAKTTLSLPSEEIKFVNGSRLKMAWVSTTWLSYNTFASYPLAAYVPEKNFPPYWKNLTPVKGSSGKLLTWACNLWVSKGSPTKQAFTRILWQPVGSLAYSSLRFMFTAQLLIWKGST